MEKTRWLKKASSSLQNFQYRILQVVSIPVTHLARAWNYANKLIKRFIKPKNSLITVKIPQLQTNPSFFSILTHVLTYFSIGSYKF